MDDLIPVVEPVDRNHVLADEFVTPVMTLFDFLEYRVTDFVDVERGHLEPRAAAGPAGEKLPIVGPVQLLQ